MVESFKKELQALMSTHFPGFNWAEITVRKGLLGGYDIEYKIAETVQI